MITGDCSPEERVRDYNFTERARGESVFIAHMYLISSDYVFQFKRMQFPINFCIAMTMNKSQVQSLKVAGNDLSEECFPTTSFMWPTNE